MRTFYVYVNSKYLIGYLATIINTESGLVGLGILSSVI